MTEGVEVEVKFALDSPDLIRDLIERPRPELLAGFEPADTAREVVVVDRYLDTAGNDLEAELVRVRLRESGGTVTVTFKRQGVVERGVTERVELEGQATAQPEPARWPDSAARRAVAGIAGERPLLETAVLRQRRLVRDLRRGEARVELSLDRLEALDGENVVATRWELEAELKEGSRDALGELSNALQVLPGVSLAAESKRLFAMLAVANARSAAAAPGRSPDQGTAMAAFARIADAFASRPDVTGGTGFGTSPGLRRGGRIFAMVAGGNLVLKLPAARVGDLLASGDGLPFDAGKGRPMREWVALAPDAEADVLALAKEAFDFSASRESWRAAATSRIGSG